MNPMGRIFTASAAAAIAASALLVPAAAQATPSLAAQEASSLCTVTGGELKWGVKEGFRSYISGAIANGSWDVVDGASYETPLFGWKNPVGEVDATTGEGSISFTGSIHFTGHDGVLDLLIGNPTVVLNGDGTAQLLLDTKSNNAQGELVIEEQQAYLGKIEGIGQAAPAGGDLSFTDASTVLTSDGAAAFGGFYASGDELDPVSLSLQFGPCFGDADAAAGASGPESGTVEAVPISEDTSTSVPWLPIAIGGVAVIIIGVTVGMLIAGRKKGAEAAAAGNASHADVSGETSDADGSHGSGDPLSNET